MSRAENLHCLLVLYEVHILSNLLLIHFGVWLQLYKNDGGKLLIL